MTLIQELNELVEKLERDRANEIVLLKQARINENLDNWHVRDGKQLGLFQAIQGLTAILDRTQSGDAGQNEWHWVHQCVGCGKICGDRDGWEAHVERGKRGEFDHSDDYRWQTVTVTVRDRLAPSDRTQGEGALERADRQGYNRSTPTEAGEPPEIREAVRRVTGRCPTCGSDEQLITCHENGYTAHPDRKSAGFDCPDRFHQTAETWPAGISDGLTLPCSDCGEMPRFGYSVTDEFWRQWVPDKPERLGVVCLPCLDRRSGGVGLAAALLSVQWTGIGHTVELKPHRVHEYDRHPKR